MGLSFIGKVNIVGKLTLGESEPPPSNINNLFSDLSSLTTEITSFTSAFQINPVENKLGENMSGLMTFDDYSEIVYLRLESDMNSYFYNLSGILTLVSYNSAFILLEQLPNLFNNLSSYANNFDSFGSAFFNIENVIGIMAETSSIEVNYDQLTSAFISVEYLKEMYLDTSSITSVDILFDNSAFMINVFDNPLYQNTSGNIDMIDYSGNVNILVETSIINTMFMDISGILTDQNFDSQVLFNVETSILNTLFINTSGFFSPDVTYNSAFRIIE